MLAVQTALVIFVPECGAFIESFRKRYDPSAADGCPAHVTLLFPFRPADSVNDKVLRDLAELFASVPAFTYALTATRRFPGVLYLAPEPDQPFREMTLAIWKQSPSFPPYGGRHPDIVPHVCIAQVGDERELDKIEQDFARASQGALPILTFAEEATLIQARSGRWQTRSTFRLGGTSG